MFKGSHGPNAQLTLIIRRRDGSGGPFAGNLPAGTAEDVSVYSAGGMLQRFAKEFVQETLAN